MKLAKRILRPLLIALFWVGVWDLCAYLYAKPLIFPAPRAVCGRLLELMGTWEFYRITLHSLWRILLGIVVAIVIGSLLAFLTARVKLLRELLLPLMTIIKATPVASFIILMWLLIGAGSLPTFITMLIVIPVVWTNLDEGFSQIDPKLSEMTRVYGMPPLRRLTVLTLPSLRPYFTSACRTSLGLAWKAGVAAEVIATPLSSIGTEITGAKTYMEYEDLFAWTLTVILLSLLMELLFTRLLREKREGE